MAQVYLESSEGKKVAVRRDLLQNLGTLSKLMKDLGCLENEVIPLPEVPAKLLKKVLQWCEHELMDENNDVPNPPVSVPLTTAHVVRGDRVEEISSWNRPRHATESVDTLWGVENDLWEQEFLNKNKSFWHPLLLVANYLDQRRLSYSISGRVAGLIKGKDPETIRKLFRAPKRSSDLISLHSFASTLTSLSAYSIDSFTSHNSLFSPQD